MEWAASSINTSRCASQILLIPSRSAAWPVKSTAITAFVLFVSCFRILSVEILYVSGQISAKTGLAPQYKMQFALAAKVSGVVITSSPGPIPAARQAQCNAAVPLLTATAYLAPV